MYTSAVCVGAMIFMRIGIAYYFTQVMKIGINGIWIGMYADWVFRIVFFLPRFIKGKWLDHELIKSKATAGGYEPASQEDQEEPVASEK